MGLNCEEVDTVGFLHPRQKLAAISEHARQLWVVAYVNQEGKSPLFDEACRDVEASAEGGADAVVLINEWCSLQELEDTLGKIREKFPKQKLGVNFLGDKEEPYGFADSFRLANEYGLSLVWTDFSGVDLIEERESISLHGVQEKRPPLVFYCSGVHMKYSTLKDPEKPIEVSALQAMGWVDGVIVTGPKTGVACDPQNVKRVRQVVGDYPVGVASGVSSENVGAILPYVDFYLVASSLQDSHKRIVRSQVEALSAVIHRQ